MSKVFAAFALAIGLSLAFAGPAAATEDDYINDLESYGFTGETSSAITMGYQICSDVASGIPEPTTISAIYENTGNNVTHDDAQYIYEAAVLYLCA